MAACMIRSCVRYSSSKSFFIDLIKIDPITKNHLGILYKICAHCNYHTSVIHYKKVKLAPQPKPKIVVPVLEVWKSMTVLELAHVSQRSMDDILDALYFADPTNRYKPNSNIHNTEVIFNAIKKLGVKCKLRSKQVDKEEDHDIYKRDPPEESVVVKRRPVVTIMGHVDHGKTTLLDSLRHTSVVETEFGGITQHIGAFNVKLDTGEAITFLDTPGHAAFKAMRARGARVTDIVVLVVAADDGVMEQTIQSIEMAKTEQVPIIVAINKIDKPQADIRKTEKMLSQQGIVIENLGGNIQSVNISALKKINLNQLIEAISTEAELLNLRGDPTGLVEGTIIESTTHPHRGKVATILISRGTLKNRSILASGLAWGKVRSMFDHLGNILTEASLSDAVQIIGWKELPNVGDEVLEVNTEQIARSVLKYRESQRGMQKALEHKVVADEKFRQHNETYQKLLEKKRALRKDPKLREVESYRLLVQNYQQKYKEGEMPEVNIIIKADVVGSVEAILDVLVTYTDDRKCRLNIVHYGVGQISENDIELAKTFDATIYAFNTTLLNQLSNTGIKQKIVYENVIYKLVDHIKEAINQNLPEVTAEEIIGVAEVLKEFEITEGKKKVKVAGCRCIKGMLKKSANFRLKRGEEVVHIGKLASMRHLKDEVTTIQNDKDCGLRLMDKSIAFQQGDSLECFINYQKKQVITWDPGF